MNFSKVYSAQSSILTAHKVDIEVDISKGLHSFTIVGLPDKAIDESRDRVSASIKNSGITSPKQKNHKVVISLAPANIKKTGPNFDLPIALAYLQAIKEIKFNPENRLFVGELSLDGKLRKMNGVLPIIIFAKKNNFKEIFLPLENIEEASLIKGINIYGVKDLNQIINHLNKKDQIKPVKKTFLSQPKDNSENQIDFSDIKGQEDAKRALSIAAAGGHNIAFYGPPGTGKTMLARSFKKILPSLSYKQIIECTSIHSIIDDKENNLIIEPPFRSPHHTASYTSIIGGGTNLKPGEITLAHNGILFLDELPEFDRRIIESLRQPVEEGSIFISRINEKKKFPAKFILIVSMNPCPCGYYKTGVKVCKCQNNIIEKYQKKISGPMIDRIDMWVEVNNINNDELLQKTKKDVAESESEIIKKMVIKARKIQKERFKKEKLNKEITPREIQEYCDLNFETKKILNQASEKLNLSARSYHRILKISRTIADLEGSEKIKTPHLLEALHYRKKD